MPGSPASSLRPGQKILALVDESHLLAAARSMNKSIDWLAVREYLLDEGESPDNHGESKEDIRQCMKPAFNPNILFYKDCSPISNSKLKKTSTD